MWLGQVLAAVFIVGLLLTTLFATLAIGEQVYQRKGRKPFARLRRLHPGLDRLLTGNALINRPLSYLAAILLLVVALIRNAVADINHALLWGLQGPLWLDALWMTVVLYLLFGVVGVISEIATEQAMPLLKQGFAGISVPSLRRPEQRDEDALLRYSYRDGV